MQKRRFRWGKAGGHQLPVQANHTPCHRADSQRRPQLIAKPERREDLAIPGAALRFSPRRLIQPLDGLTGPSQVDELVGIVLEELIGQKCEAGVFGNRRNDRAGEEQGGLVDRGAEDRVNRDDGPQPFQCLDPEGAGVEPGAALARSPAESAVSIDLAPSDPPTTAPL